MEEETYKIEESRGSLQAVGADPAPGRGSLQAVGAASAPAKVMIDIRNLVKTFKNQEAVKAISFTVNEGESFGFIGPNGAGKTTTIRILSTLLEPTEGEAYIDGISVTDDPDGVREVIGYMPDYFGVYDGMKVWEYLDFFAAAYRKKASSRKNLIEDVLEITDLVGRRDMFIEALSKGMRQRLCIAKTLLHDPKVLILDEPASGLDPRARIELKELLKELNRMGKTIFISSHILPELADICSTIGIIEAGSLLAYGAVHTFMENIQNAAVRSIRIRSLESQEKVSAILKARSNVIKVEESNGGLQVEFSGDAEEMSQLLEYLVQEKLKIVEFSEKSADLEDVFMKITKGVVA
jgi:ABC-2 type transport system ATP-binding protein